MKLLPWIGLAGLLYFMLKPEEVEAAPPPPEVTSSLAATPFLVGKTIGIQPIKNPCFSRVKRNSQNADNVMGY